MLIIVFAVELSGSQLLDLPVGINDNEQPSIACKTTCVKIDLDRCRCQRKTLSPPT